MKKEDIDFLKELQHELNTQTNDGNADPVYWGIMEKREVVSLNPEITYFVVSSECEQYTAEEFEQHITDLLEESSDIELKDYWDDCDHTDFDELTYMADRLHLDYYIVDCEETDYLSRETGCFLTKRAAADYIKKCGYNHTKPRTFAMTAYRNYELGHLLKILKKANFDDIKIDE